MLGFTRGVQAAGWSRRWCCEPMRHLGCLRSAHGIPCPKFQNTQVWAETTFSTTICASNKWASWGALGGAWTSGVSGTLKGMGRCLSGWSVLWLAPSVERHVHVLGSRTGVHRAPCPLPAVSSPRRLLAVWTPCFAS